MDAPALCSEALRYLEVWQRRRVTKGDRRRGALWQTPGECRSQKPEKVQRRQVWTAELNASRKSGKLRKKERPLIGQGRGH